MNECHLPAATVFLQGVCHACMFRSVCASNSVALALRSVVLSVLKGGSQNLRGGGGAAPRYVALARTLMYSMLILHWMARYPTYTCDYATVCMCVRACVCPRVKQPNRCSPLAKITHLCSSPALRSCCLDHYRDNKM